MSTSTDSNLIRRSAVTDHQGDNVWYNAKYTDRLEYTTDDNTEWAITSNTNGKMLLKTFYLSGITLKTYILKDHFLDWTKPTETERALWDLECPFPYIPQERLDERTSDGYTRKRTEEDFA